MIEHNAVKRNVGNTTSFRLAVNAMCQHCMGCTKDHYESGVKGEIRHCSSKDCPLWYFRPYQMSEKGEN